MGRGPRKPQKQSGKNVWSARVHVPIDLQPLLGKEIWRSLETTDYNRACDLLPAKVAEIKAEFETARCGHPTSLKAIDPLDSKTRTALLERRRKEFAKRGEAYMAELLDEYRPQQQTLTAEELRGIITSAESLLKGTDTLGYDTTGITVHELAELASNRKLGGLAQAQVRRAIPDVLVHDRIKPYLVQAGYQPDMGLTLKELIEAFSNDHRRGDLKQTTKGNHKRSNEVLLNVLGEGTLIRQIKRADIERVVKTLKYLPVDAEKHPDFDGSLERLSELTEERLSETAEETDDADIRMMAGGTVNKYLGNIQTLFRWAYDQQHIDANPALSIKLKGVEGSRKRRFHDHELGKLFPQTYKLDGINWIPLIALYQGMRGNEISQLRTDDITQIDGVHCIRVAVAETGDARLKRKGDGRSLKTKSSRRDLPIHQRLIDLGFLHHVEARRKHGHATLFDVKLYKNGSFYDSVRDDIAAMIRDAGVYVQGETSFHSLRHNFTRALRDAGVPADHRKALGGWSDGKGNDIDYRKSAEEGYGQGFSPASLKNSLDKIKFSPVL